MKTFYATLLYPSSSKSAEASPKKVAKVMAATEEKAWAAAYDVSRQFGAVVLFIKNEQGEYLVHDAKKWAEKF